VAVSRKRVIRLTQQEGLVARVRRRFKHTTDSDHDRPIAPNLLDRQFDAEAPNRRWVSDTTELLIGEDGAKLYLAAVRRGLGGERGNDRHLVLKALDIALRRRCPDAGPLHHSDRGSPYASEDDEKALAANGITCSMSRRGNCIDNAAMESWLSTVKSALGEHFESYGGAKGALFDDIEVFYDQQTKHSAIGYLSPAEYEKNQLSVRLAA
jgi:transposase InsO family protein